MAEPAFRLLDPAGDGALVRAFLDRAADYVHLESGLPPDDGMVADYFSARPGADAAPCLRPGLFRDGRLDGISELALGWPGEGDAWLGLMILAPEARGQGLGRRYLGHLIGLARAAGALRMFLCVLDRNPRGRAFWEREGFRHVLTAPPQWVGNHLHIRHRLVRDPL